MRSEIRVGRFAAAMACLLALLTTQTGSAQQPIPFVGDRTITVMSRNVYHGVNDEIFAVAGATGLQDLLARVAAVYQGYVSRDFHKRGEAIAAEIAAARPELVGLQEAILVRTQFPPDGTASPATTVAFDYVQILRDALAARGLRYEVVAQAIGLDVELPSALGFDVRHTDREVILARADLTTADLKLTNAQAHDFHRNCALPGPLGSAPIVIRRGWVSVDAKIRGRDIRFVSTHLDGDCLPFTSEIQQAQAAQLVAEAGATDLPLVLVGDLNTPADGNGVTYNLLAALGFSDAWTAAGQGPGYTCCQQPNLLNPASMLQDRIDFVLFRGPFAALAADVTGDEPADKTTSGWWPSDHAGVVARLRIEQ